MTLNIGIFDKMASVVGLQLSLTIVVGILIAPAASEISLQYKPDILPAYPPPPPPLLPPPPPPPEKPAEGCKTVFLRINERLIDLEDRMFVLVEYIDSASKVITDWVHTIATLMRGLIF